MDFPDRFDPDLRFEHVLFTFTLGLGFGLLICGSALYALKARRRRLAAFLVCLGLLLGAIAGGAALDAGPWAVVDFRMKPYASRLVEAAGFAAAGVLGAALAATAVLSGMRWGRRFAPIAAAAAVVVAVVGCLFALNAYNTRDAPHLAATAIRLTPAARVTDGLELPTGLAVASNGDVAVVEMVTARFHLYAPAPGGLQERVAVRLPTPGDGVALHVAFHPGYPAQPFVFVTLEADERGGRYMNVVRGRISGNTVDFTTVIQGLPLAKPEERGQHFGSALTFCGDSLFVTTGDTEGVELQRLPLGDDRVIRKGALDLSSGIGKVLRYRLNGVDLEAAGVVTAAFPIYAMGFRNPFGASCDPETGYPVVAENGPAGHDQVRVVPPGSNHEWPVSAERVAFTRPLLDSGAVVLAPTGIAYRRTGDSPELLLSTFQAQAIYGMRYDSSGARVSDLALLREVEGGAYAIAAGSDGCVYFTDIEAVWRLEDGRCSR